jgi:hypothetical protein
MERLPVTRRVLAREIVLSAASRPLNVGVALAVLVAAIALSTIWLLPVALLVYVSMVVATALDADRAAEVGEKTYAKARGRRSLPPVERLPLLAAPVNEKVELACTEERRIRKAIAETNVPLTDVSSEVERLMTALGQLARHADVVYRYLSEQDESAVRARLERLQAATSEDASVTNANAQAVAALEEQLAARAQLERQLSRFDAQMEHLAATLGAIHAQIVRMSVEEEAGEQRRVAEQVRDLRQEVAAAADALQEAYDDVESR